MALHLPEKFRRSDSFRLGPLLDRNDYIPRVAQRAALYLIGIRRQTAFGEGMGLLGWCPKEIVKMIAIEVWALRRDAAWIKALTKEDWECINYDTEWDSDF